MFRGCEGRKRELPARCLRFLSLPLCVCLLCIPLVRECLRLYPTTAATAAAWVSLGVCGFLCISQPRLRFFGSFSKELQLLPLLCFDCTSRDRDREQRKDARPAVTCTHTQLRGTRRLRGTQLVATGETERERKNSSDKRTAGGEGVHEKASDA